MNYAKNLPRDTGGEPMQNFPAPYKANTTYQVENGAVSSVISLNPNTTTIEVAAFGGQGAVIRWVPLTETAAVAPRASVVASGVGANFDHYIAPSTFRRFVVPKETGGAPTGQAGSVNGLYQRVARINAGATASSVLLTEY
jgi:hypothetical protein